MSTGSAPLDRRPVLAAALGVFALSALLLPAAPGMGDSAEMTLALALAGILHPTGYPLYVIAGHLFARLVHGAGASWFVAANLWSALGAAVAAGGFTRIVQHLSAALDDEDRAAGRAPLPAFARAVALGFPVVALALDPVWIDSATTAEVYSWSNACLAAAAAFMLGRLRAIGGDDRGDRATHRGADLRSAAGWGALCGLCGTQHATTLLFVPPMSLALVAALVAARRWRASLALAALGGALVPLASYVWIPWRAAHPAAFQWPVGPSALALWLHVRGASYTYFLGHFAPSVEQWALIRAGVLPLLLPGVVLGTLLAMRLAFRPLRFGLLALLLGAALQIAFLVRYGVPDPEFYFLPALMVSLLAATPILRGLARRAPAWVALAAAVAIAGALGARSVPRALASRVELARVDAGFRRAWREIPFDRGIVLWRDDHYQRFVALQRLEGQRPDLYVESPDMLIWPARRAAFRRRFGFDPLAGLDLKTPDDIERIAGNVRRLASVPVLVLPEVADPRSMAP